MGKIITFRSPMHGQCQTTATAIATAMMNSGDTIITHVQPRLSAMENYFGYGDAQKQGVLNDTGMNNLVYNSVARTLTEEDIKAAAISISPTVSLLPALGQGNLDSEKDLIISRLLTKELPKYYKYVFIDLGTETGDGFRPRPLIKEIVNAADMNIIVLNQNRMLWKQYDVPNVRYILSDFEKDSKGSPIRFRFEVGAPAHVIPHCTEYKDALAEGNVKKFFERNQYKVSQNTDDSVTQFLKRASEVLK